MLATYVDSNRFNVIDDHSSEFVYGRRVRSDCGVDGVLYSTVVSSVFSSPYTTVTINENILTSNLSDVLYGIINVGNSGSLPNHNHGGVEGQGGALYTPNIRWSYYDSNITAQNGIGYAFNTTSGSITLTLPSNPSDSDIFGVKDAYKTADVHHIIIDPNGKNLEGEATPLYIDAAGVAIVFAYINEERGWVQTSEAYVVVSPPTYLDRAEVIKLSLLYS